MDARVQKEIVVAISWIDPSFGITEYLKRTRKADLVILKLIYKIKNKTRKQGM